MALPYCMARPYNLVIMNDATARFRRAFWRAVHQLDTVRLQQWERSRLTLPQLRVLFRLRRAPGTTTGELARALGITVATASGLVGKLVERGLVRRTTAPDDRRREPLRLTDAGAALVGELSDVARPFLEQVAAQLGDDLGTVTAALERLGEAAAQVRGDDAHGATPPVAGTAAAEAVR